MAGSGHRHERVDVLTLDVVEAVVEHARLGGEMKHRINVALGQQRLYADGIASSLRVDADDIEEAVKSGAEELPDEALAPSDDRFQYS